MTATNSVTLPTAEDLQNTPVPLSDYARLLGAKSVYSTNQVSGNLAASGNRRYDFGEVWLRTRGDNEHEVQTATWRAGDAAAPRKVTRLAQKIELVLDQNQNETRLHSRDVFNEQVAILPCFMAGVAGVGVQELNNKEILTIDDQAVSWPLDFVDAATRKRLNQAYAENNPDLVTVGSYTRPLKYDYAQKKYQVPVDVCYYFEGRNYVRVADGKGNSEWLNCDTVKVTQQANGLILPQQAMLAGSFDNQEEYFAANYLVGKGQELDVSQYAIGKYLNTALLENLRESTRFTQTMSLDKRYRVGLIHDAGREL